MNIIIKLKFKCQDNNYIDFSFPYGKTEAREIDVRTFINTIIENNSIFLNPPVLCVQAAIIRFNTSDEKVFDYSYLWEW